MPNIFGRTIRRALALLLRPAFRFLLRRLPVPDPWERLSTRVSFAMVGSRRDFSWYFEGESTVQVKNLEGIQGWLRRCTYASDEHLFQEPDFWQHPRTFEHLRRGDCEDFALWAWRKLVELDYDAELVVGRRRDAGDTDSTARGDRHAWIVFRRDGQTFVYEPAQRIKAWAVQPLAAVQDRYIPEFGVGPDRKGFVFCGYLLCLQEEPVHDHRSKGATELCARSG